MESQRVIEIRCKNGSGVLNRITSIFSARRISIDSLISCESETNNEYVIFVELSYDWKKVGYICRLIQKLVEVIEVNDITDEIYTETELTMIKVHCNNKDECLHFLNERKITMLNIIEDEIFIEYTNTKDQTNQFISELNQYGAVKYLKSGRIFLK